MNTTEDALDEPGLLLRPFEPEDACFEPVESTSPFQPSSRIDAPFIIDVEELDGDGVNVEAAALAASLADFGSRTAIADDFRQGTLDESEDSAGETAEERLKIPRATRIEVFARRNGGAPVPVHELRAVPPPEGRTGGISASPGLIEPVKAIEVRVHLDSAGDGDGAAATVVGTAPMALATHPTATIDPCAEELVVTGATETQQYWSPDELAETLNRGTVHTVRSRRDGDYAEHRLRCLDAALAVLRPDAERRELMIAERLRPILERYAPDPGVITVRTERTPRGAMRVGVTIPARK